MADIYIRISDENGDTLHVVNIYEEGSDSEYADEIVNWLETYAGTSIVDEEDIP